MSTVSIAIATWNGSRHLEEQLGSILAQTRLPDQIVLRDDRSSDDTVAIASRVLAGAPFDVDIAVNEQRLGSTGNFASALSSCTGDIVFFCDQDDIWDPGKVERLSRELDAHPEIDWIFCDARLADASMQTIGPSFWLHEGFDNARQRRFLSGMQCQELLSRSMVMGASMAFRRQLVLNFLPIGAGWIHDEWIALALAAHGAKGGLIAAPMQSYRTHSAQQIGINRNSPRARPNRDKRLDAIAREVARLDVFIASFPGRSAPMAAKRDHMLARSRILRSPAVFRLFRCAAEWMRGGYRYSYSRFAAARDILGF